MRFKDFAPVRFSFRNPQIVCLERVMSAISVPEKNAERIIRIINIISDAGSIRKKKD